MAKDYDLMNHKGVFLSGLGPVFNIFLPKEIYLVT